MDSNPTRRGHKTKRLTQNQFKRHLSKIPFMFPRKASVDITPVVYIMFLAQCVFDLKRLSRNENVKYPLAIMYVSLYKLLEYFDRDFNIIKSEKLPGSDYYLSLNNVEREVAVIHNKLTYLLLGTVDTFDRTNLVYVLNKLGVYLSDLCASLSIELEHISFLSVEFFKEMVPYQSPFEYDKLANRLSDLRSIYLDTRTREGTKISKIDKLLRDKFEEIEK